MILKYSICVLNLQSVTLDNLRTLHLFRCTKTCVLASVCECLFPFPGCATYKVNCDGDQAVSALSKSLKWNWSVHGRETSRT